MKRTIFYKRNPFFGICLLLGLAIVCLAACNNKAAEQVVATQAPVQAAAYQPAFGNITANGTLGPVQQVQLSFSVGGRIESLAVEVGEHVTAGQVLATLDDTELQRAVAQANVELQVTQTRLAQLKVDAVPVPERALAATSAISNAQTALAQARVQAGQRGNYDIIDGQALAQAERALQDAQNEYQKLLDHPLKRYGAPDSAEKRALEDMQKHYEVTLAQYRLHAADRSYAVGIAQAETQLAQAQLTLYEAQHPVASQAIALAELDIERARMALEAARKNLAHARLIAPFDGTVSAAPVSVGEWTVPGALAVELIDTSRWRVETKNVGELQIARVEEEQEAQVRVNAFQDEVLHGRVVNISPVAVVQQGDTTYTLVIELDSTDLNLRPGMTAQVEIVVKTE